MPTFDISDAGKSAALYVHGPEWDLPMQLYNNNLTYRDYQHNLMTDVRTLGSYYMTFHIIAFLRARTSACGMESRLRVNMRLNSVPGMGKSYFNKFLRRLSLPGFVTMLSGDSEMGSIFHEQR
jgi:hypothetical protein